MKKEEQLVSPLINHHFCIKHTIIGTVGSVLDTTHIEAFTFDSQFDWDFLFDETIKKTEKRFLLLDKITDWCYLQWNVTSFDKNKKMALFLSEQLQTEVAYFFIDPWIFTCSWVVAHDGKLVRAYSEAYEEILNEEGVLEQEQKIRVMLKEQDGEDEFWEDKFWELYETLVQPIEIINSLKKVSAIKGLLN